MTSSGDRSGSSTWGPLAVPIFRSLWMAALVSNVGTWMHDVSAGWLMTTLTKSTWMVSLVQSCTTLPMFLLALPAGALADVIDRRLYLLTTQTWMLSSALLMGVLTLQHRMTPELLLLFTFLLGLGTAMNSPAWHSVTPELVPRYQLASAVALNGLAINVARAVGPAIGGLVVVVAGPGVCFMINSCSFFGVVLVLYSWKRPREHHTVPAERFFSALRVGLQHVRHSPAMRSVLVRAAVFVFFSSSLWALLPLLVKIRMGQGATAYGALIGLFGAGAVAGATVVLPRLRRTFGINTIVGGAWVLFSLCSLTLAAFSSLPLACAVMFGAGSAWLCILSNFHLAAQSVTPGWVRARALSVYLLAFFGAATTGSTVWGLVAQHLGLGPTMGLSGSCLLVGLATAVWFPLSTGETLDFSPSHTWPEPEVVGDYPIEHGPVLVTVEYQIDPSQAGAFREAMEPVRRHRLQNGVLRWGLFVDLADPGRYHEVYLEESWAAHLRQHERVSALEWETAQKAYAFHLGAESAPVYHYMWSGAAFPDDP